MDTSSQNSQNTQKTWRPEDRKPDIEKTKAGRWSCGGCFFMLLGFYTAQLGICVLFWKLAETVPELAAELGDELAELNQTLAELGISISPAVIIIIAALMLILGIVLTRIGTRPEYNYRNREPEATTSWGKQRQEKHAKMDRNNYKVVSRMIVMMGIAVSLLVSLIIFPKGSVLVVLPAIASVFLMIIAALYYIIGVLSGFRHRRGINQGSAEFKDNLVRTELARHFNKVFYDTKGALNRESVYSTNLIRRGDKYSSDDYISGEYRGTAFEQADVRITEEYKDSNDDWKTRTLFTGRWLIVKMPKEITGRVYLRSNNFPENRDIAKTPGMQQVFMEEEAFNSRYELHATDPHEAFYLITPQLIETLHHLLSRDGSDSYRHAIGICFSGGYAHVAVNNLTNAFNVKSMISSEDEIIQRVRAEVMLIVDVITSLVPETRRI